VAIYRDLRVGREANHDIGGAADLYYSETEMRRQADHANVLDSENGRPVPWLERALLFMFWAISGYDVRPVRSAGTFVLAVVAGGLALYFWGFTSHQTVGQSIVIALGTSVSFFAAANRSDLTIWGQLINDLLRLLGPVLIALTALGIRAKARR
jgi:hypothetical protein